MTAALQQLRHAIIGGQEITHDDTAIVLDGGVRLPRGDSTNFRSLHGRGAPYTLETIYFQYQFREYPYNEYFQSCKDKGVPHAFLIDKKDLLAYLSGAIDTCVSISDDSVVLPPETLASLAAADPSAAHTAAEPPPPDPDTASQPPDANDPAAPRERLVPHATPRDSPTERSRKREREQCVLDASFTVIGWDYSQLRDKLMSSLSASRRAASNDHAKSGSGGGGGGGGGGAANGGSKFDPRGDRYTNNEGRFWRENLGSDFSEMGIDMSGSFKAKPKAPASQSVTRDHGPGGSSGSGLPSSQSSQSRPSRGQHSGAPDRKKLKSYPQQRVPIVIVPSGDTSLLTAMNAVEFMNDGHFLSREEMKKNGVPLAQPARKMLRRKPGGNCSQAEYIIVSNPNRLAEREWDQVIAVVCSGQSWQFKKWPLYKGSPQLFFQAVQGFYFHFDDSPPSGEVREWPVRMMPVSRDKRHTDGSLRVQFWSCLDSFVARKKSHLRY